MAGDAFHPDLTAAAPAPARVHHVRAADLDAGTAQTDGMRRFAAISGRQVGSDKLWMGETHVAPAMASGNHHHGESETAIFVRKGHPEFVYHDGEREIRIATEPGDYIFVPPYLPHREENPDTNETAEVVIARTTQRAIVVNLDRLTPL
ncbi:MAG: cupin domain-containing protein [Actinomycetia bacterium]|nr:cupin domain-containing protein [Actinomycetes bacterium]